MNKREELEWELAEVEYEGRISYLDTGEKKELLIHGMLGYSDMKEKDLIEYIKDNYKDGDYSELLKLCDEFEASIAVTKMLTTKGEV